jgi:hypothetical protein
VANTNGNIISRITRSEAVPRITVLEPARGSQLGEQTTIRWNVVDDDSADSDLTYQIAYSPDGGLSWSPIGVNMPGDLREFKFDSSQIQKSDGRGVLRVFVSDGINTTFTDITGLTPTAAAYPSLPDLPQITIAQQRGGSVIIGFVSRRGQRYAVESSRGFTEWESVKTLLGDGSLSLFSEPIDGSRRFYRIKKL